MISTFRLYNFPYNVNEEEIRAFLHERIGNVAQIETIKILRGAVIVGISCNSLNKIKECCETIDGSLFEGKEIRVLGGSYEVTEEDKDNDSSYRLSARRMYYDFTFSHQDKILIAKRREDIRKTECYRDGGWVRCEGPHHIGSRWIKLDASEYHHYPHLSAIANAKDSREKKEIPILRSTWHKDSLP